MTMPNHARKVKERQMTSNGGKILIPFAEAVRRLVDGPTIHCFMNPRANMLLGADWERAAVMEVLAKAPEIHETGAQAQAMNHGVACVDARTNDYVFFATKPTAIQAEPANG